MALAMPPAAPSRADPDAVLKDPTFRQSIAFIHDVQTRFRPTPARFQEFLAAFEALHQHQATGTSAATAEGGEGNYYNAGLPTVHDKMAALLGDQPDLLARFEAFLPHGYALRRRLEREAEAAAAREAADEAAARERSKRVKWQEGKAT